MKRKKSGKQYACGRVRVRRKRRRKKRSLREKEGEKVGNTGIR